MAVTSDWNAADFPTVHHGRYFGGSRLSPFGCELVMASTFVGVSTPLATVVD